MDGLREESTGKTIVDHFLNDRTTHFTQGKRGYFISKWPVYEETWTNNDGTLKECISSECSPLQVLENPVTIF